MCLKEIHYSDDILEEENIELDIKDFPDIEKILSHAESPKKENKFKLVTRRIDTGRIRHKNVRNLEVYTSLLKNMKTNLEVQSRCGVIIYTHQDEKTYFCLGVDTAYGDLTDFGGGTKKTETPAEGALRELEEESQGIFGKITPSEVSDSMCFYTNNMLIMFVKRDVNPEKIKTKFHKKVAGRETPEVSDVHWIEKEDFIDSINGRGKRIYSRVRKILGKVTDIISAM